MSNLNVQLGSTSVADLQLTEVYRLVGIGQALGFGISPIQLSKGCALGDSLPSLPLSTTSSAHIFDLETADLEDLFDALQHRFGS